MFFNLIKKSFKSFEVLRRSTKIKIGSKREIIFVLGSLRKKVLRKLLDFALKIISLYSLTKSVFQYSEGLIQII